MRVLVVEDEPKLAELLARGLREEGHPTDVAAEGKDAVWMARATPYDAIVLDVMLPGLDGFAVCRELRAAEVWTPVLFLTARDGVADRVRRAGQRRRRLPRQAVLVRRAAGAPACVCAGGHRVARPAVLEVGIARLDPAEHRAWRGDVELELSAKEFTLLELFMRRSGQVISRLELLEGAGTWGTSTGRTSSTSMSATCARRSTGRSAVASLETVRGVGYRLRD